MNRTASVEKQTPKRTAGTAPKNTVSPNIPPAKQSGSVTKLNGMTTQSLSKMNPRRTGSQNKISSKTKLNQAKERKH